jgi:hypothetical protein
MDDAGVSILPAAFTNTPTLYTRKYEYYDANWSGDWPQGLKTSRYFTRPDYTYVGETTDWAYHSEKMVYLGADDVANCSATATWGINSAVYNLDLIHAFVSGDIFGNGLTGIRAGRWYKYETWMQINSAINVADGVLRIWIDDVEVYTNNAVAYRSSTRGCPNGTGWQSMWFGGNYTGGAAGCGAPSTTLYRYIDDLYLSTTLDRDSDKTAPVVTTPKTIASNGTTFTIPFSETVTSATSGTGGFTISASGGAATLAYASGSGTSSLVYTISRVIASSETVTLTYAVPGSGAVVEDTTGNDLVSFSGSSITNSSTQAPPTLSTKTIATNGTTLTLVFDEAVTTTDLSGAGGWTIAPSGGAATLAYASGSGTTSLVYTISRRIMTSETATVSYSGTYVNDTTSLSLTTITNSSVTNNSDSVAAFIDNLSPSGVQACTSNPRNVTLSLTTNETATARMSLTDIAYSSMTDTFTNTSSTSHSEVKSFACGASYTYYVRTSDALGNVNTSSSLISFSIASPQIAGPGGLRTSGGVKVTH